jgi:hypothetical protein
MRTGLVGSIQAGRTRVSTQDSDTTEAARTRSGRLAGLGHACRIRREGLEHAGRTQADRTRAAGRNQAGRTRAGEQNSSRRAGTNQAGM